MEQELAQVILLLQVQVEQERFVVHLGAMAVLMEEVVRPEHLAVVQEERHLHMELAELGVDYQVVEEQRVPVVVCLAKQDR